MRTLLFFDDWFLHRRENFSRHIGTPTPVPEGTLEDPYVDPAWGYPSVFQDPVTGTWRCLYQGQLPDGSFVPVIARSTNGIEWEVPDLSGRVDVANRVVPHQVISQDRFTEWSGPYLDPQAEGTDEWLKGLAMYRPPGGHRVRATLFTSPDGLEWSHRDVQWHPLGADPVAYPYWNEYRQAHVITARPRLHDRRLAIYETTDWEAFSEPELMLQADADDTPCAEIYGMPVVPYEGMFIGMLWVYHVDPAVDAFNKFVRGRVDAQLAYSYNGWHFQRTLRETFIENSEPGQHGSGCIYPYSVVPYGDSLRIYSSGARGEHAQIRVGPSSRQGALLMHTLRRDGFVYLSPDGGSGELHTRLLLWNGGEAQVNVSCPYGGARVEVTDGAGDVIPGYSFDDCQPFADDDVRWMPSWSDGRTLSSLAGRVIRLKLRLFNGRLYAIRGDFDVVMAGEATQYEEDGTKPILRSGF